MKANYKVIANKQKMLEKEIENFEPTSTMSVLLMRYSIIQGLLQVKLNEKMRMVSRISALWIRHTR